MKPSKAVRAEVERLVYNWGKWHYSRTAGYAPLAKQSLVNADQGAAATYESPGVPVLYGEAEDVDKVMFELSVPRFKKMRRVLELQFIWQPPVHQRFLELDLRQSTYYRFVDAAIAEFWGRLKRRRERGLDTAIGKK